jgi:hypothetical protein
MYASIQEAEVLKANSRTSSLGRPPYRQPAAKAINWTLPGFMGKVRILTTFGAAPVECLRVNDPIRTTAGRTLLVKRIRQIALDRDFLIRHPEAQPILIPMKTFAEKFPEQDMLVSPRQEMTVEIEGVLHERLNAKDIIGFNSVVRAPHGLLTYYTFEMSEPGFVYAEGVPVFIPAIPPALYDEDEEEGARSCQTNLA